MSKLELHEGEVFLCIKRDGKIHPLMLSKDAATAAKIMIAQISQSNPFIVKKDIELKEIE